VKTITPAVKGPQKKVGPEQPPKKKQSHRRTEPESFNAERKQGNIAKEPERGQEHLGSLRKERGKASEQKSQEGMGRLWKNVVLTRGRRNDQPYLVFGPITGVVLKGWRKSWGGGKKDIPRNGMFRM